MNPIVASLRAKDQWLQLAVTKRWLSETDLVAAIVKAQAQHAEPVTLLLDSKQLSETQAATLKAEAAGVAFVEVDTYQVDATVLKLIPEAVARKHQVLPLYRLENALTVAMADPWDVVAIDALRASTKLPMIHPAVGTTQAIRKAIERFYGLQTVERASVQGSTNGVDSQSAASAPSASRAPMMATNEVSISKLIDALLSDALEARASDIHLEPDTEHTRIRFRIDGVLHERELLPIGLHEALCSRIKILAKLDITEHRLPQDGSIAMLLNGHSVDLRVSTYPTIVGENVVVRLLDQAAMALQLAELGFAPDMLQPFRQLIRRPHGMLLVTGPTGSGKTTTLYAGLTEINSISQNIVTIEDPVEYRIPLIRQTQINPKAGLTFAAGLRSLLRQDPDVIMVGEIRDQETAEITLHAALTGHLVFSTLHTNDAAGAVARLLDMSVEPFLLASTLLGVIGQRLVRRICPNCQEGSRTPQALRQRYPELEVLYRGRGCPACRQTGLSGRLGVFELLVVDETMKANIVSRCSSDVLKALAVSQGMRTMRADGLLKVQQGLTTIEELDRVIPPDLVP